MAFAVPPRPQASADYLYDLTEDGLLVIIDQDLGGRSVTNDMEQVLADIAQAEGRPTLARLRVMYRDSQGEWCRVVLDQQGRYDCIRSFGKRVSGEAEALELLRQVPR